jgi:membrane-associated phospholipid phosphatase
VKVHFAWAFLSRFLLLLSIAPSAFAGGSHQTWRDVSDVGAAALIFSSLAIPTAKCDWQGLSEAAWSDGLGEGISLLGKSVIHEERPNHRDNHSFPSGHATLAFAAATTMYRRYGWEYGVPAYAIATLTGYARIAAKEHHWWDVVAGAGFGIGSGWLMTHPFDQNVRLTPWVGSDGAGLALNYTW